METRGQRGRNVEMSAFIFIKGSLYIIDEVVNVLPSGYGSERENEKRIDRFIDILIDRRLVENRLKGRR